MRLAAERHALINASEGPYIHVGTGKLVERWRWLRRRDFKEVLMYARASDEDNCCEGGAKTAAARAPAARNRTSRA
jgi:hypothetical protein